MSPSVFDRLVGILEEKRARFDVLRHQAVFTSEEAAQIRGTSLSSGAKALICKCDQRFVMIVMPADLRLDSKSLRRQQSIRSLRFASRDEVQQLTELTPGSIPPFGSLFELPTLCDHRLSEQVTINFNAGDHSVSISMPYADYFRIEQPTLGVFARV